jgi:hypothetical protein
VIGLHGRFSFHTAPPKSNKDGIYLEIFKHQRYILFT